MPEQPPRNNEDTKPPIKSMADLMGRVRLVHEEENESASLSTQSAELMSRIAVFSEEAFEDKNKHPFRNADGAFLKIPEIANSVRGIIGHRFNLHNQTIVWHIYNNYFKGHTNALAEARKSKDEEQIKNASIELIAIINFFLEAEDLLGISIYPERQNEKRSELQFTDENGEFDNYETLEGDLLSLADPDDPDSGYAAPDPLFVNGRLPTPDVLADACKRLYEKWYPETEGESKIARKLIKEKCVDQVIRELKAIEGNFTKRKLDPREKRVALENTVVKLTTLMRQLSQQRYMDAYVNIAAFGPHSEDIKNTDLPDDLVYLVTMYNRLPYNLTVVETETTEVIKDRIEYYRAIYKAMSEEDKAIAITEFDNHDNSFFKDEAGQLSPASAYVKIEMVFREKGISEEQIATTCAGLIAEMVDKMVQFENKYKQLHEERGEVGDDLDRFKAINAEIREMKREGKGVLRKDLIGKARYIVEHKDFIDIMKVDGDADSLLKALEQASEELIEDKESPFYFDYSQLADPDLRLDERDRFFKAVDAHLRSYDTSDATKNASNIAKNTDEFVKLRDEGYRQGKEALNELLESGSEVSQADTMSLVKAVSQVARDMIAIIEAHS